MNRVFKIAGTPPGGYMDKVMIPLTLIMLILSLMTRKESNLLGGLK
jgi:hypothetical protein